MVNIRENSDTDQTMNQNNDNSTHCQMGNPSEDFGRNLIPEWIGSSPLIEINVPKPSIRSFIRVQQQHSEQQASQNETNQLKISVRSKLPMHDQDLYADKVQHLKKNDTRSWRKLVKKKNIWSI